MNTPSYPETIRDFVFKALKNSNVPPKKNDDYRYYHCNLYLNTLNCIKVNDSNESSNDNSSLLYVKSYIPEQFDKHILKYKFIPNKVIIEEKST